MALEQMRDLGRSDAGIGSAHLGGRSGWRVDVGQPVPQGPGPATRQLRLAPGALATNWSLGIASSLPTSDSSHPTTFLWISRILSKSKLNDSSAEVVPGTTNAASIFLIRSNIKFTVSSGLVVPLTVSP
jgi:hypothetical protein